LTTGTRGRSADLATDVPTCLPAMRDDGVDTRVHGTQASATEPTACRCAPASWTIPTQGEGSPQNVETHGSGGEAGSQAVMS